MCYDKKSLATRNSLLFAGSSVSSAFGGLLAAAIFQMDGLGGVERWRCLFIIEGGVTVGSEEYKNVDGLWSSQFCWLLVVGCWLWDCQLFPYNRTIPLCLTAPPFVLAVPASYFWARHADKTGERSFHVGLPMFLATVSFIILIATTNFGARYFAMVLMMPSLFTAYVLVITWMSNSCPRSPAKRAVAIALMIGLSNSPYAWAPILYPSSDGPRYTRAMECNTGAPVLGMVLILLLRLRLIQLNKKDCK
ncbi:hypothetical protein KGF57_002586 [Candida theae]|uniref:Major facilitator superfamily (MFS) profile domain-containing protein n=1 Tax=Candida theae TaxID=1198502 RepID=A0AAD5FYL1_9ASCO|nr:uncharacterized protein KGF57_002586 [Candida theae]KAI5958231.1 hypothetical protein KGF57_002586 [Candida theae]